MSRIPKQYQPDGLPLRWQDEVSGVLPMAVYTFRGYFTEDAPLTAEQIELIREYCEYYVNAPCWQFGPEHDAYYNDFIALRERIKVAKTAEEINAWILACLDLGIDPL